LMVRQKQTMEESTRRITACRSSLHSTVEHHARLLWAAAYVLAAAVKQTAA
jgi:hypothetical protein